MTEAAKDQ